MKVTIEFELPDGQELPLVSDILTLTSPDWYIERWHIDDVMDDHQWLTKDQAREVLKWMEKYHDANHGINWDFIASVVDNKFPAPEEVDA
jgi:hypothetical protein